MQIDAIIAEIRSAHRERCFAMEQRKRADLSLLSFLRTQAGWRLDLPEKERKAIAERAKAFVDGKEDEALNRYRPVVEAAVAAREPFDKVEATALKEMERLAVQLPVWEAFGKDVRGFGPASLAVVVGEAGDLDNYPNPAKLWKRMGVGIMDGIRQGGLAKNASKEDWIAHGYNRMRRSRLWNIGDALIKSNRDGAYRTIYLERKEYELARDPEMKPIQAHRRAQRFMEKRLLLELWKAWRQTMCAVKPKHGLPAADNSDRETSLVLQPNERVSPKRRASVLVTPDQGMPGAPIPDQQATPVVEPTVEMPAVATGHSATATQKVVAGRFHFHAEALDDVLPTSKPRKVSRPNGNGRPIGH